MKKILMAAIAAATISGATHAVADPLKDAKLDISGVAQIGYSWSQKTGSNDSADTNRLRLKIAAMPADKVIFVSQLELTKNKSPKAFGSNVPGGAILSDAFGSDSPIVDMYLVLNHLKFGTLLVGQMPTPVSYELNTPENQLETVNYSQFVGMANRDRGIGLLVPIGKKSKSLVWGLNGTGSITGGNVDIDDRNNYGAMLERNETESLSYKGWVNFGNYMNSTNMFAALGQVPGAKTEMDVNAYGAGFDYKAQGFHLASEYALAKINIDDPTKKLLGATTRTWYVQSSYVIPETNFQVVGRYDLYNPMTKLGPAGETEILTAGLNWNFEKNARLQLNREIHDGPNDRTDLQLSIGF